MKNISFLILSLLLLGCVIPGWVHADDEFTPSAYTPISKGDAMLIRIENVGGGIPEYREIVDSDGNIKLPFIGLLSAVGKTTTDLATEIATTYDTTNLSTNTKVHLTVVTRFDPPPERKTLIRAEDPRQLVPAPPPPTNTTP